MRNLFASTCLTTIAFGLILPPTARAATVTIDSATTAPVATATASSGAPADISITDKGSIKPTSGAAVIINSDNKVANAGTIDIENANGATGILADTGVTSGITNSGTIKVSESYTRTDTNKDGVLDGPFAQGSNRYGIHALGAFTGDIVNSGTITVQGNSSAGIALDGPLTGKLSSTGTVTVVGDDSVGIRAGDVSGNVDLAGTVNATGKNASAVVLGGDIGGALTIQSTLNSTGYSSTSLPSDTSKLGPDNLLQSGPTLVIGGNVAGGVMLTALTTTTDSDGKTTTVTTASKVASYGSAPAMQVGSASRAITLGAVASDKDHHGLVINGTVSGLGVYDGKSAAGLVIGGAGGAVTIDGGMAIGGTVSATANNADATAARIGSGATVVKIDNSGTIKASGGGAATSTTTALAIDAGAQAGAITNSGTISAAAGKDATAYAVIDRSGTVTSLTNSGSISASGGAHNVAIDLSAATGNTIISQPAPAENAAAPSIAGDVRFGSGNDQFQIAGGSVTGNTSFGAGDDTLALSGKATYTGAVDFGGGADMLTIGGTSVFTGSLTHSGGVAAHVDGGTLALTSTGATGLSSLSVTGGGTLGVSIDPTTGAATLYKVSGAASFDAGSKIALRITDVAQSVGDYRVIEAGNLTGGANIATENVLLPYLYKSSIVANDAAGTVDVTVARKTAAELGLNRSESSAYDAIYAAIAKDKPIGDSFLSISDGDTFRRTMEQMLPDHAGGAFESVTEGSRATWRMLADPDAPIVDAGGWGFWLQQVGWGRTKSLGDTSGYRVTGWGASGGAEIGAGAIGHFGLSFAYLAGQDENRSNVNEVNSAQYELAAYWRGDWGGFHAFARGSAATIDFTSRRRFSGTANGDQVTRFADGKWNGKLLSAAGGVSYRASFGAFSLRPQVSVDYYRLHEGHYNETGGGDGFDLALASRTSDELAASAALALGYSFFDQTADDGGYLRAEIEGGRREIVGGHLGATTAHFAGGQAFTLTPDDDTSGWTGAVRLKGGASRYTLTGEVDAEQRSNAGNHVAIAFRAGLQVGF